MASDIVESGACRLANVSMWLRKSKVPAPNPAYLILRKLLYKELRDLLGVHASGYCSVASSSLSNTVFIHLRGRLVFLVVGAFTNMITVAIAKCLVCR